MNANSYIIYLEIKIIHYTIQNNILSNFIYSIYSITPFSHLKRPFYKKLNHINLYYILY